MDRRTVLGFAVGPIGAAALSFISLPLMTWIFPPDAIGKLSMLQVALQFSTLLFCLGLDQAYVREYHENGNKPALLLNATLPGFLLLSLAALVWTLLFPTFLSQALYGDESRDLTLITTVCLVVAYLSRFLSLILRMQDRGLAFSMSQILSKGLLLIIVIAYVFLPVSRDFRLLLLAQATALLLTLLVFAWNTRRDWLPALRARLERPLFVQLFGFGCPLIFGGIASWGLNAMGRIFLRNMSTYEELAIYSVAASIAAGVTIFSGIFNTIWTPLVFKWVSVDVDTDRINSIARQISAIILLLVCIVGLFSWLLPYILPNEYHKVSYLVPGCMVVPLLYTLSEVTGVGIAVSRRTIYAVAASAGAFAIDIFLCFILVPHFGAVGAMLSAACAFWIFYLLRSGFSALLWRPLRRVRANVYSAIAVLLSCAFALWGDDSRSWYLGIWLTPIVFLGYIERLMWQSLWRWLSQSFRVKIERDA